MIGVVARLGDNPELRELRHEFCGKQGSFAVGNNRFESLQVCGAAQRVGEYLDLGVFAQPAQAGSPFIGMMNIIEYGNAHFFFLLLLMVELSAPVENQAS
ncbi:hypothetical protein D9M68_823580 [compost metagenome]